MAGNWSNDRDVQEELWGKYGPEDFMYKRKGPWPQPSPGHPQGEAPAVVHIPSSEMHDFNLNVGLRYIRQMLFNFPYSFVQMFFNPGLKEVSDKEFEDLYTDTILSKHLDPDLDEMDKKHFEGYLDANEKYFIVDMEPVQNIDIFPGMYASGSKILFVEVAHYKYKVKAIYIYKSNAVFVPTDGDAWELAKYYALQGAALVTTLLKHPLLHFPYDQMNAITKTSLPKKHVIFRLLSPHWRFTLPLENAVLEGDMSIIANKWWLPYTLYPGRKESVTKLLVNGYMGIRGNNSYKKFEFPLHPPKIYSKYGDFLERYYQVIHKFVESVVSDIPTDDYYTKRWANYVAHHSPGFPNGDEIFKDGKLSKVIALYMWAVTVGHSLDHYNYGLLDVRKVPMRMRQAPPVKGMKMWPRKKLTRWYDNAKYRLAQIMFYQTTTVTFLVDCEYKFKEPHRKAAVKDFFKDLKELDKEMQDKNMQFMKLDEIASSVQY